MKENSYYRDFEEFWLYRGVMGFSDQFGTNLIFVNDILSNLPNVVVKNQEIYYE